MADFVIALEALYELEGGHVNDPHDPGGETYRGIARRYWPGWDGWKYVDAKDWKEADRRAAEFYRLHYWNAIRGDDLKSNKLGKELLEFAVHTTPARAVETLQAALNLLNNRAQYWEDMIVDGRIGPRTLAALNSALKKMPETDLVKTFNGLQFMYYAERARQSEEKERYFRGFLRRIAF